MRQIIPVSDGVLALGDKAVCLVLVLQCVRVCCSGMQCGAVRCSGAACCSVLQCVAVCCSVLQCVAVCVMCCCVSHSVITLGNKTVSHGTHERVTAHMNVPSGKTSHMGWLRLGGSLKL